MAGDVESAWIAAAASIVVSLVSLGTAFWTSWKADRTERKQEAASRELEVLKSRLTEENDAAKAKRDYEYEARKRLYKELYPLAYRLQQQALGAHNRIMNLALATRGGYLAAGADNWITGRDPYYLTALVHSLIAPLAVYELMTRKLTVLDLRLDRDLHFLHVVAGKSYQALRSDFDLVDPRYPPLVCGPGGQKYAPPEDLPEAMPPDAEQRWAWRQGLYSGQISQAVDALLIGDGEAKRVMSYAEFAKALDGVDLRDGGNAAGAGPGAIKRGLRPLVEVLTDFHPARRPVTWRILMAQAACYRAIKAAEGGLTEPDAILGAARLAEAKDRAAFDWLGDCARSIPPALAKGFDFAAEQENALLTADRFITQAVEDFARRN